MLPHLVLSLILLAGTGEACQVLTEPVESGCGYDATMKLTSRPNDLVVQKENCSKEFVKTEWQQVPLLQMESAKEDKTYTVICIDPDAPNHEKGEYYLHWLVSNVNGNDLRTGDLAKAKTITSYKGPGPVINTGLHRYIFLAFEEEKLNQNVVNDRERRKFPLLQWMQSQTDKLCGPVAGVQFRSEY
ncbi:UNVERIFIED_CONTAM: hypothetical protein PYX00_007207 [Menopon gallinae]|uniref:Phosphatidylethanolamine-binding protein n=1 Tax=Menopon gallinae TaxID=328185 RepID=A0AAW2HHZ6_9NEOP